MKNSLTTFNTTQLIAFVLLPLFGTVYFVVSSLVTLPYTNLVLGSTLVGISVFSSTLYVLSLSHRTTRDLKEPDGYLSATGIDPDTGHPELKLVLSKLPSELITQDIVELKVVSA